MRSSRKLFAITSLAAFAALGSAAALAADAWNGGGTEAMGQSTPMSAGGNVESSEVNAGAMAAARPSGTEVTGQSTGMAMPAASMTRDEAYKNATAAAHASGTEVPGQSTAMPMPMTRSSGS